MEIKGEVEYYIHLDEMYKIHIYNSVFSKKLENFINETFDKKTNFSFYPTKENEYIFLRYLVTLNCVEEKRHQYTHDAYFKIVDKEMFLEKYNELMSLHKGFNKNVEDRNYFLENFTT
jgi:hypothetical protein